MLKLPLVVLPALALLGACAQPPETWTAFVYPPGKSVKLLRPFGCLGHEGASALALNSF